MKLNLLSKLISWLKRIFHISSYHGEGWLEEEEELERRKLEGEEKRRLEEEMRWLEEEKRILEKERRRKEEEERKRLEEEKKKLEEKKRLEEERKRLEEEKKRLEEEGRRKAEEEEKRRLEEEKKLEEEKRKLKEQKRGLEGERRRLEEEKQREKEEEKEPTEGKKRKPYIKKRPTEPKKEGGKPPEYDKKLLTPEPNREIDLGSIPKKKTGQPKQPQPSTEPRNDKSLKEEGTSTRVESPYVEINLDEAKVYFVIPKQEFETNTVSNALKQLHYKLGLNGEKQTVSTMVSKNKQEILTAEELRIDLDQPLKNFEVVYPGELQGRVYSYQHGNVILYPFIAIGKNRDRMYFLYDKSGNINPLPDRDMWILLKEDFDLAAEPDVVEERWIWEKYQAKCINLTNINELIIKNRQTGEEVKVPCEASFSLEGEEVVEDDFKRKMPLFAGNSIKIKAPRVNSSGWIISIQNKQAGYKVITNNWTGEEPLELKFPDDLPCECGEFQVDICEQGNRIPIETLFFHYIPHLQFEFPRSLIIPDPCIGHNKEIIKILLERDFQNWELKHDKDVDCMHLKNGYQFELMPEKDTIRFSLMKRGKLETESSVKITIPRLKWRVSKNKTWNDKPLQIKRDELIAGTDFYLTGCTNDFDTKYDLSAILETNNQKLQEAKFIRKGMVHNLLLNQFYDTIKKNEDKITLRIEIRKAKAYEILGQVHVIHLSQITQDKLPKKPVPFKSIDRKDIKVRGGNGRMREGKGFSRQEIIEAGVNEGTIHRLCVPFDKRRKTAYSENIEILKSLAGDK